MVIKKMNDCVFCKIINGELPSKTIYEDDLVKVFLSIEPDTNGHMLVVPKKHITDFLELDNETAMHINEITKILKNKIYDTLKPDGLKLVNNYGIVQEVKHYHLHIIPIYKDNKDLLDLDQVYDILMK